VKVIGLSKKNKELLQKELEKTFDKVIGLLNEPIAESIEVSHKYLVYVEVAKNLVCLSLEDKKSGKPVHELHISITKDLDVFFSGSVYRPESSLLASSREHMAHYSTKGSAVFTKGFEILVDSIATDFQVLCFLDGLTAFVSSNLRGL
jgi:hypothetical protein